ncbi:unnamed protein product [Heligmosomoides polygyrus]|uniref:Uncharacterized protein n=1 Tax=Heligmosomoides polygyrus TaxID=6339 RepID=A0A3P7YXW3_HELPZ|nr:unnamed protein product [Heligmosomoides polygyrus]
MRPCSFGQNSIWQKFEKLKAEWGVLLCLPQHPHQIAFPLSCHRAVIEPKMNTSLVCNNETIAEGQCNGLSICGWCYDYGETRVVSREYERFNSVSSG